MIKRASEYKKLINCQKWIKLRAEKLQNNPLCERCYTAGIVTPGAEIHHITPVDTGTNHEQMKILAYSYRNLITLCHKCHIKAHIELQSKTAKVIQSRNATKAAGFVNQFLSEKK